LNERNISRWFLGKAGGHDPPLTNLLRICDTIHLHRMPWIRVADRDFAEGSKEIITAIEVIEVAGQGSP
jgi:hypothetical protein